MSQDHTYTADTIARAIVRFCQSNGTNFVFLAGNGGSGKTELSKLISIEAEKHGRANVIDMDDFVVDTRLRNSATVSWDDRELGWTTQWQMEWRGQTHRWQMRGLTFDETFRRGIGGAAQILSGNGDPVARSSSAGENRLH